VTAEPLETTTAVRCRKCPGWLVAEKSKAAGIGPVCARHERAEAREAATALPLFELEVT